MLEIYILKTKTMSEFKKSIVSNIANDVRTFSDSYGLKYVNVISFANGDVGEYNSQAPNQTSFIISQEADYEYVPNNNPQYLAKIRRYNPQYAQTASPLPSGSGSGPAQPSNVQTPQPKPVNHTQRSIERQTALKVASECVDINQGGTEALLVVADAFDNWLQGFAKEHGVRPADIDQSLPEWHPEWHPEWNV